ncbi:MAG: alkaline phosphatase [Planctomycetaceae bacterium]|nr:alkaline phosphatase [Planctomycetaceae bacterium]
MQSFPIFQCLFATILLVNVTWAQHDPQRNAVRLIAAGNYDKATKEIGKGEEHYETSFVKMLLALKQGQIETAVAHADEALKAGMPFGRLVAGPRPDLKPLYSTDQFKKWAADHSKLKLLHGPMLGAVTDSGASIWLRTAQAAKVKIQVSVGDKAIETIEQLTSDKSDFTAVFRLKKLQPSTAYDYQVVIDGQTVPTKGTTIRTFAAKGEASKFNVGFGGGAGYVPKWEYMWNTISALKPDAFLMLGDNVYIDDPTEALTNRYCYYRRQSRPEWRQFVAGTSMFAIYDDHDFGMNDCVPGPEIESPPWKRTVWNTFRQNWVNPYYGGGEKQPGCWHDFTIGDVHFILLDGRYYRTRKPTPSMLGPVQKKWLFETLKKSKSTFKVLCSPVPWTKGIKPGSRDPWDGYAEEREEVFRFIEDNRIEGLFLVAADRHRTDLRITKRPNGYDLYEFESSKLTNRHTHGVVKTPGLVWGYNKTCSFGWMEFDTTADDPKVQFIAITIDGERVHTAELRRSQLRSRGN